MLTRSPMPMPRAPPEPPSPMTTQMIGVSRLGHLQQAGGDELGLAALLGADARIAPGRVDQADDRQLELGGQLHLVERLAIPLRMAQPNRHSFFSLMSCPF